MGGTTGHGLPFPTGTDRVMDGDNAIEALARAVDTALLGDTGVITPAAAGFTLAAGFTSLSGSVRKYGKIVAVHIVVTLPALGAGNISNVAAVNIPAAWAPCIHGALNSGAAGGVIMFYANPSPAVIYVGSTADASAAGLTSDINGLWMTA